LLCLVVAAAYVAAAHAGFVAAFPAQQITAVWPATGLALAALVLGGSRLWPGVLIGAFVAHAASDAGVGTAAVIAVGSTVEAAVGAGFIARVDGFRPSLERTRDVLTVVCLVAFVSTVIGATVGVAALWSEGIVTTDRAATAWLVWWLGGAWADLLVAPVLLVFGALIGARDRATWSTVGKSVAAAGLLALLGMLVFRSQDPIAYVLFPVVFAIAFQLRQPGTTLGALALVGAAVWQTRHGNGPFTSASPDIAMLRAQIFVGALALASLLLMALRAERQHAESAEQEQRSVNRDLAAANAAKSRFLAHVSHELRTPIQVIGGFTETLLSGRSGPLTSPQREQLQAIQRSGDHLNGLITELLELARNEVGKTPLEMEPVECSELLRDVVDEMRQLASAKGLRLDLDDAVPVVVLTDRRALRQILINLTGNAIKFTEVGDVRLGVTDGANGSVRLTVADSGPGIVDADRNRVFEAFEQGGLASEGLGLGLHISRSLADRLGAQLTLRTVLAAGSEFTIELPPESRQAFVAEDVAEDVARTG